MDNIKQEIKDERNWHKRAILISLFHQYQVNNHGSKRPSKWTIEQTARELELSLGFISESLNIARSFPSMNGEGLTREEVLKRIRRNK